MVGKLFYGVIYFAFVFFSFARPVKAICGTTLKNVYI
jgi:hypothetical protein